MRLVARDGAVQRGDGAASQLVVAKSIEKIYRQNAQNIGLLTSTDFGLRPAHRRAARRSPSRSSRAGSTPSAPPSSSTGASSRTTRRASRGRRRRRAVTTRRAADDPLREDPRARTPSSTRRARRQDGRDRGEAGGRLLRARRRALLARVRDADGRRALPPAASAPDAKVSEPESVFAFRDHLTFLDLIMPKAHQRHGPRRAGAQARHGAGRVRAARRRARSTARCTATGSSWGPRPSATTRWSRSSRCPGQLVDRAPTATRAWRARSGASRSAWARPTWRTPGSRATCASPSRRRARFVLKGKLRDGRVRQGRHAPHPEPAVLQERRRHRQGARVRRRRHRAPAARRARDAHQHGGRGGRFHRASSRPTRSSSTTW